MIRNPILQSDLRSTYNGVVHYSSNASVFRRFLFFLSVLSLGLLAPLLLRYESKFIHQETFLDDVKLRHGKKKNEQNDQEHFDPKTRQKELKFMDYKFSPYFHQVKNYSFFIIEMKKYIYELIINQQFICTLYFITFYT